MDLGYTACCPKLAAICLISTDVLVSKQIKFGVKSMCVCEEMWSFLLPLREILKFCHI